ncbi:MAG: (Fe-S)-binding protein [Bacteroidales bacterium]
MITQVLFLVLLIAAISLFTYNVRIIRNNILLGKKLKINDKRFLRLKKLFIVAIGQSKISGRIIPGILHIIVYSGFIIVNIEIIEIIYDGITGAHRSLNWLPLYSQIISALEIIAFAVILTCAVFLIRRNVLKINRFRHSDIKGWPRIDANVILITEIILMVAFLVMNTADSALAISQLTEQKVVSNYLISSYFASFWVNLNPETLHLISVTGWWFHIAGIFAFLNYLPYSKHFHILLSFPNVYYSKLKPLGYISNMESVTREVKIAMGLEKDNGQQQEEIPETFGAKDIKDLTWKSLMDAYSCTECGRCTSVCPANLSGKNLSPRKIVMDTRDRLEELGSGIRKKGIDFKDEKMLFNDYITPEEIWACTTCNACTYECPVNIDPLAIIIELRRYIFMEKSAAPSSLNSMSLNIENNGAPWQYPAADRFNWAGNLTISVS